MSELLNWLAGTTDETNHAAPEQNGRNQNKDNQ